MYLIAITSPRDLTYANYRLSIHSVNAKRQYPGQLSFNLPLRTLLYLNGDTQMIHLGKLDLTYCLWIMVSLPFPSLHRIPKAPLTQCSYRKYEGWTLFMPLMSGPYLTAFCGKGSGRALNQTFVVHCHLKTTPRPIYTQCHFCWRACLTCPHTFGSGVDAHTSPLPHGAGATDGQVGGQASSEY